MKDEEFVKLKFWLDAELTMIRVFLAIIVGLQVHRTFVWAGVGIYIFFSVIYAASRMRYVESKHLGYMRLPR